TEKAADDVVLRRLQEPLDLASALVKLGRPQGSSEVAGCAALSPVALLPVQRVARLLEQRAEWRWHVPWRPAVGTAAVGLILGLCI
ncbi:MAG: hypothetical protein ACE5I2_14070, partial [Anaerolineae bacterium]